MPQTGYTSGYSLTQPGTGTISRERLTGEGIPSHEAAQSDGCVRVLLMLLVVLGRRLVPGQQIERVHADAVGDPADRRELKVPLAPLDGAVVGRAQTQLVREREGPHFEQEHLR